MKVYDAKGNMEMMLGRIKDGLHSDVFEGFSHMG